jgi:hypothetical protein
MKCFKGWTIGLAATALLAAPGAILAQQTPPSTPPSPSRPAGAEGQPAAAMEHLTKAKTALADIPETSLTGSARTQIVVLQRRIAALEQTASKEPAPIKASWSSDVAAIDRTLTEMLGGPSAPPASQPTGTAGSAAPSAAKTAEGSLDETARTKLQEVRAHVTAFAAAMGAMGSGAPSSPSAPLSTAAAAAAAEPSPAAAAPASPRAAAPTPSEPAQQPAQPPAASPTTPQSEPTAPAKPEAAETQVDADAVKRHLTAARDSLSQLTQLPAATQLTGDARTQVSQLITNFNELITTNSEWRASYAKVQSNLNALIGDQRTDEAPATPTTPAAGTPGAVGTSGTIAIDPSIKAKLVEFRTQLLEFEKAAGGAGSAPSAPARQPEPSAAASSTATPAGPAASETAAAASPAATAAATPTASAAASSVTGSTGSTAEAPRPAGTSGRTPAAEPEPQSRPSATPDQGSPDAASKQSGHAEAIRHIEAIEAIVNGRASDAKSDSPAGTSGRATSATSLDRAQIEQIKQHLTELRRALAQSGGR